MQREREREVLLGADLLAEGALDAHCGDPAEQDEGRGRDQQRRPPRPNQPTEDFARAVFVGKDALAGHPPTEVVGQLHRGGVAVGGDGLETTAGDGHELRRSVGGQREEAVGGAVHRARCRSAGTTPKKLAERGAEGVDIAGGLSG